MKNALDSVSLRNEVLVAGSHPELADMGNPRGEFFAKVYYVEATVKDNPYRHKLAGVSVSDYDDEFDAKLEGLEELRSRIERAGEIDLDLWIEGHAQFGSQEWTDEALAFEAQEAREGR